MAILRVILILRKKNSTIWRHNDINQFKLVAEVLKTMSKQELAYSAASLDRLED